MRSGNWRIQESSQHKLCQGEIYISNQAFKRQGLYLNWQWCVLTGVFVAV
jgi:hypothetical protein